MLPSILAESSSTPTTPFKLLDCSANMPLQPFKIACRRAPQFAKVSVRHLAQPSTHPICERRSNHLTLLAPHRQDCRPLERDLATLCSLYTCSRPSASLDDSKAGPSGQSGSGAGQYLQLDFDPVAGVPCVVCNTQISGDAAGMARERDGRPVERLLWPAWGKGRGALFRSQVSGGGLCPMLCPT